MYINILFLCRLISGTLDVRKVLNHKVKLGLGTGGSRAARRQIYRITATLNILSSANQHRKEGRHAYSSYQNVHKLSFYCNEAWDIIHIFRNV